MALLLLPSDGKHGTSSLGHCDTVVSHTETFTAFQMPTETTSRKNLSSKKRKRQVRRVAEVEVPAPFSPPADSGSGHCPPHHATDGQNRPRQVHSQNGFIYVSSSQSLTPRAIPDYFRPSPPALGQGGKRHYPGYTSPQALSFINTKAKF